MEDTIISISVRGFRQTPAMKLGSARDDGTLRKSGIVTLADAEGKETTITYFEAQELTLRSALTPLFGKKRGDISEADMVSIPARKTFGTNQKTGAIEAQYFYQPDDAELVNVEF